MVMLNKVHDGGGTAIDRKTVPAWIRFREQGAKQGSCNYKGKSGERPDCLIWGENYNIGVLRGRGDKQGWGFG